MGEGGPGGMVLRDERPVRLWGFGERKEGV